MAERLEVMEMSDDKSQADARQAKTNGGAPKSGAMPFQEIMEKMMAQCGCCWEQMGMKWATCCDTPPEKKADPKVGG